MKEAIHHLLDIRDENTWMLFGTLPIYPCLNDEYDQHLLQRLRKSKNVTMRNDPDGRSRLNVNVFTGDVIVIDIGDENGVMVFINPEILETSGTQCDDEGCLSIPGETKQVERPNYVKVRAFNEKGEQFVLEGEELLARAILHENDHLDGILYIDHVK